MSKKKNNERINRNYRCQAKCVYEEKTQLTIQLIYIYFVTCY